MLYSIKNIEDLQNLNKLVSLQNQVNELRLQKRLGEQNYHQNRNRLFEPMTDAIKNTSQNITETMTETCFKNNQTIENLNTKLPGIMND